jgi:multisubunit Na+/H+ antiporter MnhF subunit
MLLPLLFGGLLVFISTIVQVVFVVMMVRYLIKVIPSNTLQATSIAFDIKVICSVLILLFIGHLSQIAIWAVLFINLGEFNDFLTAFYHSAVNFSSLGYGDITMSERWRLLGALEAGNGVLMFGLSTGTIFSVMTRLFNQHHIVKLSK